VDWIHLAQDSDQWRALVNTIMNLGALLKAGSLLTSRVAISFSRTVSQYFRCPVYLCLHKLFFLIAAYTNSIHAKTLDSETLY